MCNSLTIVIPNRNRDLDTVRRSLGSIVPQLTLATRLVIVDYGSQLPYQLELEKLVNSIDQVELILCPTQGQLWNKSRCINIVLRSCTTTHFMVSDMDMIWHPWFLKNQLNCLSHEESVYFTVGVLTQEESALNKAFENYKVKFQTNREATGITIFPTEHLRFINGFDEFYHGWGSEDTDVHIRLRNAGYKVRFRESVTYFKHQWHEKFYRNKRSKEPYHNVLEKINQHYLKLTQELKLPLANVSKRPNWGVLPCKEEYEKLNKPDILLNFYHIQPEISSMIFKLRSLQEICVSINISHCSRRTSLKTKIKKIVGKKTPLFINADLSNESILELIIEKFRNCPYLYEYDRDTGEIKFVVYIISKKIEI